jgi:DNA-damage-inducible protein J
MSNIQINVRDEDIKKQAQSIFKNLGMDMTTAINMFLRRVTIENGLPFPTILPTTKNGFTPTEEIEILEASQEAKQGKNIVICNTEKDMQEYLNTLK